MAETDTDHLKTLFLERLLSGDRMMCSQLVYAYLDTHPSIEDLYENLLRSTLYEVGRLWETNQISVATEHMATAITEGLLNELYDQMIARKRQHKSVVLACVEHEMHQVGIKMVGDIFEKNGWDSFFLGAGIPTGELIRFIKQVKPDVLAISLSIYFNVPTLLKMVSDIRAGFPDLPILLGGQAIRSIQPERLPENCLTFHDLYQLEAYLENVNLTQKTT